MPPLVMRYVSQAMTTIMIQGLHDAYAHKLGELRKHERAAGRLRRELGTLQQAIWLFEPGWSGAEVHPIQPKRPSRWGSRGQGMRAVMEVMGEADAPLTVREIATLALQRRGKAVPPQSEFRHIAASLTGTLRRKIGKGIVRHTGEPTRWSLEGGGGTGATNAALREVPIESCVGVALPSDEVRHQGHSEGVFPVPVLVDQTSVREDS